MSSIGRVQIKGNILPKRGTIGRIEVRFDGEMPHRVGTKGLIVMYQTDGNLQVIFRDPKDAEIYQFKGKKVDVYYDY